MPLENSGEIAPEGMKRLIEKQYPAVHVSGGESKANAVKNSIA